MSARRSTALGLPSGHAIVIQVQSHEILSENAYIQKQAFSYYITQYFHVAGERAQSTYYYSFVYNMFFKLLLCIPEGSPEVFFSDVCDCSLFFLMFSRLIRVFLNVLYTRQKFTHRFLIHEFFKYIGF